MTFRLLQWDTEFLGFPTASVSEDTQNLDSLRISLQAAAQAGVVLAYWLAKHAVEPDVLSQYGGRRVVGHVVYEKVLESFVPDEDTSTVSLSAVDASGELDALAVKAGHLSRFRLDERLAEDVLERMYKIWIRRSLGREIATDVLGIRNSDGNIVGLATYRLDECGEATVGLVSVADSFQGQGLGRRLMQRVERDVAVAGGKSIRVATQDVNIAACSLYEKLGYRPFTQGQYYHFWLKDTAAQ